MKTGFDALSAYNVFLEIAVESGIFALIAFIGFLVMTIKDALKSKEIFVYAALISVCAVMLHGLVDTVFFRPQIQFVFWTMVAIISAYSSAKEK
jgi:putative inorganic carbon (HCO3(-)) transporter